MNNHTSSLESSHFPVMLNEVLKITSPFNGGKYIDCTFGHGGYSKKILEFPDTKVIALDRDPKSKTIAIKFKKNIKLSSKIKKTNFKIVDVINNLEKINFNDYNLVTGSAFLDILPKTWFKNFHKLNVDTEIVYFALNYNGNFKFFPKHKDDKKILNNFNKDQKSDKGIGEVAVGPDCTELINKVFKRTHKTYVLDSTWDVSKNYEFQIYFLNFCREIIQKNKLNFDDWLKFRLKCIKEKNSRFILNNTDFLAIKK